MARRPEAGLVVTKLELEERLAATHAALNGMASIFVAYLDPDDISAIDAVEALQENHRQLRLPITAALHEDEWPAYRAAFREDRERRRRRR